MKNYDLRMLAAAAAFVGMSGTLAYDGETAPTAPAATQNVAAAPVPAPRPVAMQAARAVLDGVGVESGVQVSRVDGALAALGKSVGKQSDPGALRTAFKAYYNYKAANPEKVRKPYLYYVDYGLDARTPRGYVFDMEKLAVVDGPFMVSHGRGSASPTAGVPTRFSNRNGSNATSLGLYLTQETYAFRGKSGGRAYKSVGLRLKGLSGSYNSAARERGVVAHGAPYVTATRAGRSEGCPAMEPGRAERLLPKIANGGMVFHFSPLDRTWMKKDPWVNRA